jgi:hypothetical protein
MLAAYGIPLAAVFGAAAHTVTHEAFRDGPIIYNRSGKP